MVQLYLKHTSGTDTGWHEVIVQANQKIKLTSENPYITESEQYTLDVSIPMDVLQNRLFFQNMQRMNVRKRKELLDCRLEVNGKKVIFGTAKLRSVTEDTVKVQLVAGRSEINLKSEEQQLYIDEMELGRIIPDSEGYQEYDIHGRPHTYYRRIALFVDYKGEISHPTILRRTNLASEEDTDHDETPHNYWKRWPFTIHPTWDTTKSEPRNFFSVGNSDPDFHSGLAIQPNLVYVLNAVFSKMGYEIVANCLWSNPWLFLHIASAFPNAHIAKALPHWTVKEFLQQIEQLFCCTFFVDQEKRTVEILFKKSYFHNQERTEIAPLEEYSAEMSEESEADIFSGNIEYDKGNSPDGKSCLSEDIRDVIARKEYESTEEMAQDFAIMENSEKVKYIYTCSVGGDWYCRNGVLARVDWFKPLFRAEGDKKIELKICPAAIMDSEKANEWNEGPQRMIVMENPNESKADYWCYDAKRIRYFGTALGSDEVVPEGSAQAIIESGEATNTQNPDRMELFFNDEISRPGQGKGDAYLEPFTDGTIQEGHRWWSLSFYDEGNSTLYLGQHHFGKRLYNSDVKFCFKFMSDNIPNTRSIFIANSKKYICEKIETDIDDEGINKLMTGYFFELES